MNEYVTADGKIQLMSYGTKMCNCGAHPDAILVVHRYQAYAGRIGTVHIISSVVAVLKTGGLES